MDDLQKFVTEALLAIKSGEKQHFLLLYLDISNFRFINQQYGNIGGDLLLKQLENNISCHANIMLSCHPFADHFLCLVGMKEVPNKQKVLPYCVNDIQAFEKKWQQSYPAARIQLACGICPVVDGDVVKAIDGANLARKQAKKQKLLSVCWFDELFRQKIEQQIEAERVISAALEDGLFCFYLQPKVDLLTGQIVGAEALARRIDQNGTVIYPDNFLPIMEQNGLVLGLDREICRQVCVYLEKRIKAGLPVVRTSVNLSRLHTYQPDSAQKLHAIVQEAGVPVELLEFELTETILLDEFSGAKQLIDDLRSYGYQISIDGFGSGYAGIDIWRKLNFDVIKLDRQFLLDKEEVRAKNEAIIPNIIDISNRLQVEVLCEGVETAEQCEYLHRLGCDLVQGYYFDQPMAADDFYEIYVTNNGKYETPITSKEKRRKSDMLKKEPVRKDSLGSKLVILIILCAFFLTSSILLVSHHYRSFV